MEAEAEDEDGSGCDFDDEDEEDEMNDNVVYDDDEESDDEEYDCRGPASDTATKAVKRATDGRRVIKKNVLFEQAECWGWVVYMWPAASGGWSVGQVTSIHRTPELGICEGLEVELGHTVTYYAFARSTLLTTVAAAASSSRCTPFEACSGCKQTLASWPGTQHCR